MSWNMIMIFAVGLGMGDMFGARYILKWSWRDARVVSIVAIVLYLGIGSFLKCMFRF